jgi:hypothetical protein
MNEETGDGLHVSFSFSDFSSPALTKKKKKKNHFSFFLTVGFLIFMAKMLIGSYIYAKAGFGFLGCWPLVQIQAPLNCDLGKC